MLGLRIALKKSGVVSACGGGLSQPAACAGRFVGGSAGRQWDTINFLNSRGRGQIMHKAPYVLNYADERQIPAESGFDPNTTYTAERPNGAVRYDQRRAGRIPGGQELEWLWPNCVPVKQVTLIEGAAGAGKSFAALDIVARATRGLPWPVLPGSEGLRSLARGPVKVLYIGQQDDAGTVGRRLNSLGADLQHIHHFQDFRTYDPERGEGEFDERPLAFPQDLPAIRAELENLEDVGLVVIDSLAEFCDGPAQLAETLRLLGKLANDAYAAIVVTLPAQTRFDAQGALKVTSRWRTDAARCVWTIAVDPEDPARRLFIPSRINFCEEPRGATYRLAKGQVIWDVSRAIDPNDPLAQQQAIEACLTEIFREGTVLAPDVYRQGGQCGFSAKQLRSTGKRLGIESRKRKGFAGDGGWEWVTAEQRAAEQLAAQQRAAEQPQADSAPASMTVAPAVADSSPERGALPSPAAAPAPGKSLVAASAAKLVTKPRAAPGASRGAATPKNQESLEILREIEASVWSAPARDGQGRLPAAQPSGPSHANSPVPARMVQAKG